MQPNERQWVRNPAVKRDGSLCASCRRCGQRRPRLPPRPTSPYHYRPSLPLLKSSSDMIARTYVLVRAAGFSLLLVALGAFTRAEPAPPRLLSGLVWRNLGPFRGGRVAAVSGAIG